MKPGDRLRVVDSYNNIYCNFRKGDILTFKELLAPEYVVLEEIPSTGFHISHFEEIDDEEEFGGPDESFF